MRQDFGDWRRNIHRKSSQADMTGALLRVTSTGLTSLGTLALVGPLLASVFWFSSSPSTPLLSVSVASWSPVPACLGLLGVMIGSLLWFGWRAPSGVVLVTSAALYFAVMTQAPAAFAGAATAISLLTMAVGVWLLFRNRGRGAAMVMQEAYSERLAGDMALEPAVCAFDWPAAAERQISRQRSGAGAPEFDEETPELVATHDGTADLAGTPFASALTRLSHAVDKRRGRGASAAAVGLSLKNQS